MKRVASTVLLAMVCLLCLAEGWTPDNLPMPYLQDNTKYVVNPDNVLKQQAEDSLNRELYRLEHDLCVQTVLIAVKHIEGDDPFTFGMQLGKKYGIGQKERNNGLIFMLCNEDRSYTILPGKVWKPLCLMLYAGGYKTVSCFHNSKRVPGTRLCSRP